MKTIFTILTLSLLFIYSSILADVPPSQIVKGEVLNSRNKQAIHRATIQIIDSKMGAYSNSDGSFIIDNVPVGRHTVRFSAIGFETYIANIVVTSGKEVIINVLLNESVIQLGQVDVTAHKNSLYTINESAIVSAIEFSVDDAQRFAGSRLDPARMAQNFAGVLGANDLRNDIIIRGGSPIELLWRLDGLDIPNPNHFATQGATGGPVSAINTMLLDNSDFITGAFPAEYGDKMSGVFDLRTRKGNNDKYEFMGQFGFNGFELGAEGPMGFEKSSFMAFYRYSFLGLLDAMGVDFGFAGIPKYQDASFKSDFDLGSNYKLSITGLFGTSDIYIKESETDDVYTGDLDIKNGTDIYALIANLQMLFNDKLYGKLSLGSTLTNYRTVLDSITTDENSIVTDIAPWFEMNSAEGFHTLKYSLHYSPTNKHYFTFGTETRYRYYKFDGERFTTGWEDSFYYPSGVKGNTIHLLNFINWNYRISDKITSNIGLMSQYLDLNRTTTIEPRFGLAYRFLPKHSFNLGFGIHRQSLPLVIYHGEEGNDKLDFMQSIHYIAGYSYQISYDALIKIEAYYKDLSKIAVERDKLSSFSILNSGTNFGTVFGDKLKSTGIGKTYGAEISFMKHFSKGYYITATGSFVRQEYKGSDAIWRFGEFDNRYILNLLAGYELKISPTFTIEFAGKYTLAGGAPYTPIDMEKSRERNATYFLDSEAYTLRKPDYSRFDLRIDFRQNLNKVALISYISLENLFNQQNVLMYMYDKKNDASETIYQLGTFFVGGFRIEF